jgi:hypothetical protein
MGCSSETNDYLVGEQDKGLGLGGAYYVIGEITMDSIRLWTISDDPVCNCYFSGPGEVLPLKPYTGRSLSVQEVTNNNVTVIYANETFTLSRNEKLFHKLKNELASNELNKAYEDSIKHILQVRNPTVNFLNGLIESDEKKELIKAFDSRAFPGQYSKYLDSKLTAIKKKAALKKETYQSITTDKIKIDSAYIQSLLTDYSSSAYEQRSMHYILTKNPELFQTITSKAFMNDLCCCKNCFTNKELEEMYCAIKKVDKKLGRKSNLWSFERRRNMDCR